MFNSSWFLLFETPTQCCAFSTHTHETHRENENLPNWEHSSLKCYEYCISFGVVLSLYYKIYGKFPFEMHILLFGFILFVSTFNFYVTLSFHIFKARSIAITHFLFAIRYTIFISIAAFFWLISSLTLSNRRWISFTKLKFHDKCPIPFFLPVCYKWNFFTILNYECDLYNMEI